MSKLFNAIGKIRFTFSQGAAVVTLPTVFFIAGAQLQEITTRFWGFAFPLWLTILMGMIGTWIVGEIWLRSGAYGGEAEAGWRRNPVVKELLNQKKPIPHWAQERP